MSVTMLKPDGNRVEGRLVTIPKGADKQRLSPKQTSAMMNLAERDPDPMGVWDLGVSTAFALERRGLVEFSGKPVGKDSLVRLTDTGRAWLFAHGAS